MPKSPTSRESVRVMPTTAPLDATYCVLERPEKNVPELMLTIFPYPRAFMCGSTARQQRNGPRTFTAITRSHSSGEISSTVPRVICGRWNTAALFTRPSMRPHCSMAACAIASVEA